MTTLTYVVLDPAARLGRGRQRRAPAAARHRPRRPRVLPARRERRRARRHARRPLPRAALRARRGLDARAVHRRRGRGARRAARRRPRAAARRRRGRALGVGALRDCSRAAGCADGEPTDDVAVLVAHLAPLGEHLRTSWPAEPEALADVRAPAAPLAAAPRRRRGRDLRHHGRLPGGVRERRRACVRARPGRLRARDRARGRRRPAHGPRPRRLARREGNASRARIAHHAGTDGLVEIEHTAEGTAVHLRRALGVRTPR